MDPITLVRTALGALWMNKLRTSLTLLGIVIGVAAVISLMGIGRGAQKLIVDNITALGTNLIFVHPQFGGGPGGPIFFGRGAEMSAGGLGQQFPGGDFETPKLTLEDAYALLDPVFAPSVRAVAPEVNTGGQLIAGRRNTWTSIVGTTPDYLSVRNMEMATGSFISDLHVETRAEVVVLGSEIALQLFGMRDPTGQTVRVNGREYTVLGVLDSLGGNAAGWLDHQVVVPVTTAYYRIDGQASSSGGMPVQTINVEAADQASVNSAMEEITSILRLRHRVTGENDFSVTSQQQTIDALEGTTSAFVVFLAAIAGISLVVGGIGIMNIMLVSVTERIREIGLRMAVGAGPSDVRRQFLAEAMLLSLIGGAIGILIGIVGALLVGRFGQLPVALNGQVVALAAGFSIATGLFFGYYPARKASQLDPIEALRQQ